MDIYIVFCCMETGDVPILVTSDLDTADRRATELLQYYATPNVIVTKGQHPAVAELLSSMDRDPGQYKGVAIATFLAGTLEEWTVQ